MHSLTSLGWNDRLQAELETLNLNDALRPARIASLERGGVQLLGPCGAEVATVTGRLSEELAARRDTLAVGDWVAVRDAGAPQVAALLRRRGLLVRSAPGMARAQPIASHLDAVFIVTAVGHDFSARRLERYMVAVWDAGAQPVVVINKTDLPHARAALEEELLALAAPVVWLSALQGDGLGALEPWLKPGQTVACVGSSGVGKSTLTNQLLGRAVQAVQDVREEDDKGRHTTTRRSLFCLSGGGLLVDTPGMREFGLWSDEGGDGLAQTFADVEQVLGGCRFRDCTHAGEPGCAVAEALETGALDPARLHSYQKLQREQAWQERRADKAASRNEKRRWKEIHQAVRQRRAFHREVGLKEI
jgi:ribosome biogenesis GTPase